MSPERLDSLAAEHGDSRLFESRVIVEAARQVAAAKRKAAVYDALGMSSRERADERHITLTKAQLDSVLNAYREQVKWIKSKTIDFGPAVHDDNRAAKQRALDAAEETLKILEQAASRRGA